MTNQNHMLHEYRELMSTINKFLQQVANLGITLDEFYYLFLLKKVVWDVPKHKNRIK